MYDRNGIARVRIRYEGDAQLFDFRPTPNSRWRDLDDMVKQPGLKFNIKGPQILDRVADVLSIGPDGDTLYISTRLGTDHFELAAFSMSTGLIKGTIAKHPKYDLTTSDFGVTRLLFAKQSTRLLGVIFEAQKPQIVWLDPKFASLQKNIDATFPGHVNYPIDWSDDGSTIIYDSSSDQDPGTVYVYQPAQGRLMPILDKGEQLKGRTLAKTVAIEFTARDGHKIPAYLTRPIAPETGPAPMIVYVHGGPMARDDWRFDPTVQFFASRGYIVLQVNYRGSSGYGAAFQAAGLRARLDTVVLDDIADGARYLISTGEADPKRVGIAGGSFGGWATYMSLIKYPELYRAGVAIAAISHWREALRESRWSFDNKLGYTFWKSLLGRVDFEANEKFIDPSLRASELHQPIFIIHGGRDTTVSPWQSETMLNALKKRNPNVQSHAFPGSSHTEWLFQDRVVMLNEMALFFEKYLPSSASTPATPVAASRP